MEGFQGGLFEVGKREKSDRVDFSAEKFGRRFENGVFEGKKNVSRNPDHLSTAAETPFTITFPPKSS